MPSASAHVLPGRAFCLAVFILPILLGACAVMPEKASPETGKASTIADPVLENRVTLQQLLDQGFRLEQVEGNWLYLQNGNALYWCVMVDTPVMCSRLS